MQRVRRPAAPARVRDYLNRKHLEVLSTRLTGQLNIDKLWKQSRQTKTIGATALGLLQSAMGQRERCMYCLDAHGTDIEHFWPKASYPGRAFKWNNWLLCCTECGRIKGNRFPLTPERRPLLVDPSAEEPWQHLDFEPDTGNLVPRFDRVSGQFSAKGEATVDVLQLARREALAAGYRRTYTRLTTAVEASLNDPQLDATNLMARLREADDHGLLPWCFRWAGQRLEPFSRLKERHPNAWPVCARLA
jgi:uncharacterized protein (TIGR02646 family)